MLQVSEPLPQSFRNYLLLRRVTEVMKKLTWREQYAVTYRHSVPTIVSSVLNEKEAHGALLRWNNKEWILLTTSLLAASLILSTFASESPLTLQRALLVVICIPLMVQIPTDFSFLMSATFCNKGMEQIDEMPAWKTPILCHARLCPSPSTTMPILDKQPGGTHPPCSQMFWNYLSRTHPAYCQMFWLCSDCPRMWVRSWQCNNSKGKSVVEKLASLSHIHPLSSAPSFYRTSLPLCSSKIF